MHIYTDIRRYDERDLHLINVSAIRIHIFMCRTRARNYICEWKRHRLLVDCFWKGASMCSLAIRSGANRHLVGSFFLFVCLLFLSFRAFACLFQVLSFGSLCVFEFFLFR